MHDSRRSSSLLLLAFLAALVLAFGGLVAGAVGDLLPDDVLDRPAAAEVDR